MSSTAYATDEILHVLVFSAGVGAIAFEIVDGGPTRMILKRKDDETIDRDRLAAAVADAGPFGLD